ncbi:uncharacterized protein G2W53_039394 [Senna tora]|uniref:Uncharacterized protein n=1 Tax=Senna tora TaxID=362788 RepID=A0A834SMM2_9FABA|nr:uncharacterized protein G2W53_039394 [Senna tora]
MAEAMAVPKKLWRWLWQYCQDLELVHALTRPGKPSLASILVVDAGLVDVCSVPVSSERDGVG